MYDLQTLDRVVDAIVDVMTSTSTESIKIGAEYIDREMVKARLLKTDAFKVREVVKRLNTTIIQNPKSYAISMLYNA